LNSVHITPLRVRRVAAVALVMVCAIMGVPRPRRVLAGTTPARAGVAAGARGITSVLGGAWKLDNTPIPGARLRLRNVVNGKVEATAVANQAGQFAFSRIEGGTYVVELVDENARVVSVGQAFVIAPGETVATFVRLGTKAPWFDGFFGNAASAVASSAASQGITAIAPVQLCASPPCH
jgi:hypothetical protein